MRRARGVSPLAVAAALLAVAAAPAAGQRARQGLLSLEEARIFYEVIGSGEPIIVVHGGPGLDHGYLQPGLDLLAARNTLIYYDQRGTGRSDAPLDTSAINFDDFVDDIDALRQALGYERVILLAHSFGARIALHYATIYQENLRGLILMNPSEPGSRFAEESAARQASRRTEEDAARLQELMTSEAYEARDPATISEIYRLAFRGTMRDPDRVDALSLDLSARTAANGQEIGRLLGETMGDPDWWPRLGAIDTPTLVLHGRYDIPPTEMSAALASTLPDGELVVLNSGHFPYVEDPQGLATAVSGFLVRITR